MIYDFAVIGAGSGGLSVAAAAAQFGKTVILFEKGKMGGDCLNYGCVPSKALIAAAKHAHAIRSGAKFGVDAAEPNINFKKVQEYVAGVIAAIAPNDSVQRFEGLGVKVVRGKASFRDAHTLECGESQYRARRIVIATGSRARIPAIPGLEDVPYLTNETIFANGVLPQHLIIVGGGPVGMEMAQAHRRLGAEVTVIDASHPLAKDDPELVAPVLQALRAEGVTILEHEKIQNITHAKAGFAVATKNHGLLHGSHLLVAAGRTPNIEGLKLEAAGIAYSKHGITVDDRLRSSQRHIYAVGDVAGGLQFTHVANYHAGLVMRHALFRLPVRNRTDIIPWVTYTDPELAHVGLSEAEAHKISGGSVKILRHPFQDNDRAHTEAKTAGLVKAIVAKNGKILGVSIVGAGAGDNIHPWVLALSQGLKIKSMATAVMPYPTRGEASKRAAMSYYEGFASNRFLRYVIGFLELFG